MGDRLQVGRLLMVTGGTWAKVIAFDDEYIYVEYSRKKYRVDRHQLGKLLHYPIAKKYWAGVNKCGTLGMRSTYKPEYKIDSMPEPHISQGTTSRNPSRHISNSTFKPPKTAKGTPGHRYRHNFK